MSRQRLASLISPALTTNLEYLVCSRFCLPHQSGDVYFAQPGMSSSSHSSPTGLPSLTYGISFTTCFSTSNLTQSSSPSVKSYSKRPRASGPGAHLRMEHFCAFLPSLPSPRFAVIGLYTTPCQSYLRRASGRSVRHSRRYSPKRETREPLFLLHAPQVPCSSKHAKPWRTRLSITGRRGPRS